MSGAPDARPVFVERLVSSDETFFHTRKAASAGTHTDDDQM